MTCQPHPYFIATIQGYLDARGWKRLSDPDAIAGKSFQASDIHYDAFINLQISGRDVTDHILTARCFQSGRNVLSACRLSLPKTEPVFAVTINDFVQDIEATLLAAGIS